MGKSSTQPVITDPNDPAYDPALDPAFLDKVGEGTPPEATTLEKAAVAPYGYHPSGTPRTEPAPAPGEALSCPSVSLSDGPFDTTTIPSGCQVPLTAECAAYYNEQRAKAGYTD